MPKPTPTTTDKPKKQRARAARHYIASVRGDTPVLIVARTQKAALDSLVTIALAKPADLLAAGKNGYAVIDTTAIDDAAKAA